MDQKSSPVMGSKKIPLGSDLYDFPLYMDPSWIPLQDLTSDPPDIPLVMLVVKNPPANEGDIRNKGLTLGQEDPPEEGMATHSSILAWRIQWTEEPEGATVHGITKSQTRLSDLARTQDILTTARWLLLKARLPVRPPLRI